MMDRVVLADEVLGIDDRTIASHLLESASHVEDAASELANWLESFDPQPDPVVKQMAELVERAEVDHSMAVTLGCSDQSHLIRHFKAITGVSPGRYTRQSAIGR